MDELLSKLVEVKKQESEIIAKRREIEKQIADICDVELGKIKTIISGENRFTVTSRMNLTYDQKKLEACHKALPYKQRTKIFTLKYNVKLAELRLLKEKVPTTYNRITETETITQGAISVRHNA
jgi:hypothetical protein